MTPAGRDWRPALACLLPAAVLWLLAHPYQGIWHDARIYALTVAHHLYPEHYARDLFFVFGSQDDFSLFSRLHARLVEAVGLGNSMMLIVFAGGLLWLLAHWLLARRLLGQGFAATLFVLAGAALSLNYSPNGSTFVVNENFATARSLAMPLGLLAVCLGLCRRELPALVLALLATVLHPLLGIWPLALLLSLRLDLRGVALLAPLPAVAVLVIGGLGIGPAVLQPLPADLLASLRPPIDVLMAAPAEARSGFHAVCLAAFLAGWRWGSPDWRPFCARLFWLGLGGWLAALVAAQVHPLALPVRLQFWRVFWLLAPLGLLALVDLMARSWRLRDGVVADLWLGSAALFFLLPPTPAGVLALLFVIAAWWTPLVTRAEAVLRLAAAHPRIRRGLVAGLWLLLLPGQIAEIERAAHNFVIPWWPQAEFLHGLAAGGLWLTPLLAALLLHGRLTRPLALGAAVVALPWLLLHWDRRPPALQAEEGCYLDARCSPHPFAAFVRPGEVVHWPGRELRVFFRLDTAGYVSLIHGTGRVFSVAKHAEWARRDAAVAAASGADGELGPALCADPALDWLVLGSRAAVPVAAASSIAEGFRLVDCRIWRRTAAAGATVAG